MSNSAVDSGDARNYIVNLTGVTKAQIITVSLTNVSDSAGNTSASVSAAMSLLLGDTNADRVVNSVDITQTRRQSGEVATAGPPPNFRTDLSTDGVINSAAPGPQTIRHRAPVGIRHTSQMKSRSIQAVKYHQLPLRRQPGRKDQRRWHELCESAFRHRTTLTKPENTNIEVTLSTSRHMKTLQYQASLSSRSLAMIIGFVATVAVLNFSASLSAQDCGTAWRIVPSPNLGSGDNELYGIDAVSANNVWAVGRYNDVDGYKTLSMRWDGSVWSVVPTPNAGSRFNQLFSVAALSSNDAWAVGASSNANLINQTLIAHWDGTQWSIVPSPLAPGTSSFLYGIAAIAANDIWAVGYIQVGFSAQQPLTMHWDGTSWSVVPSPSTSPANRDILWAVSALSADNVWATGYSSDAVTGEIRTLIEHWNGSAWSIVPSPNPSGSIYNFAWGIEAVSANDVWVMGRAYMGDSYPTLIERWNGTAWSVTPSPSEQFYNELFDATALSSTDVWAVGRYGGGFSDNIAMVMHWDGSAWSVVANPNPPGATENNFLYSVDAVSPQDVWAVGTYLKDMHFQTLIERYSAVPCISPSGAVSRKTHGAAGNFDVDLPLSGNPGIECRIGGANGEHTLVFTFANPLTSVGGATVLSGTGSVSSSAIDSSDARNYVVNLTGVTNAQVVTISLANVNDSAGNSSASVSASMGVLLGDVNGNGRVSNADVGGVKAQVGATLSETDSVFRHDVNANGTISNGDVGDTKAQVGSRLP